MLLIAVALSAVISLAGGLVWASKKGAGAVLSALGVATGLVSVAVFKQPWFMFTMVVFFNFIGVLLGYLLEKATHKAGLILACIGYLVAVIIATGLIGVIPGDENPKNAPTEVPTEVPTETPTEVPTETPTETCTPAVLVGVTSGEVLYNLDSGDPWNGTILWVSNGQEATVFVVDPGLWIDIEDEKISFTAILFEGSLEEGLCLSKTMYPEVETFVVTNGPLEGLDNWTEWGNQWMKSISIKECLDAPIGVEDFEAGQPVFMAADQVERDLVAQDDEIIYGQFWQTAGYVVHVQVRPGQSLTVPDGYQGTYWVWRGNGAEDSLQARLLQATYEVTYRDEIASNVVLLACGEMPEMVQVYSLYTETPLDGISWQSGLDGWTCEP